MHRSHPQTFPSEQHSVADTTASANPVAAAAATIATTRAADLARLLGIVEVVVSVVLLIGIISDAWRNPHTPAAHITPDGSTPHPSTISSGRSGSPWHRIPAVLLMGAAPGLAYLSLQHGIQTARRTPIRLALLLATTQCFAVGALLLRAAFVTLGKGSPAAFTSVVLLLGTPTLALAYAIRWLLRADRQASRARAASIPR